MVYKLTIFIAIMRRMLNNDLKPTANIVSQCKKCIIAFATYNTEAFLVLMAQSVVKQYNLIIYVTISEMNLNSKLTSAKM